MTAAVNAVCRNIAQFVTQMDALLDTPSKKSLWTFLIPRLNVNQQNYVKQYAELPPRHNRSHGQYTVTSVGPYTMAQKPLLSKNV